MEKFLVVVITCAWPILAMCNPLDDPSLALGERYGNASRSKSVGGFSVTFLGNTTFYVSDGSCHFMVDGFLSRIPKGRTLLGWIDTDKDAICDLLGEMGIDRLDAIVVGHSHHDHALDAPFLSEAFGGVVLANQSYELIQLGKYPDFPCERLKLFPASGGCYILGDFTITLVPSLHAPSRKLVHKFIEGEITSAIKPPAHFSKYNCGDVFAIHVQHPRGSFVVTTTAGAEPGALEPYCADVFFLAVGLLGTQDEDQRASYLDHTIGEVKPRLVVPVHWDDFSRSFDRGLMPIPKPIDDIDLALDAVKQRCAAKRDVAVLDFRETIYFPIDSK